MSTFTVLQERLIQIVLELPQVVGDGKQPVDVEVPGDGWVLQEVSARVQGADASALSIQLREVAGATGTSIGTVLSDKLELFGTKFASTTAFDRATPAKGNYFSLEIVDAAGGDATVLVVQLRFLVT